MHDECIRCPFEKVYEMQFHSVNHDLTELNERVRRLEVTLGRGVLLLVANLAGVIATLAQQLLNG